MADSALPEWVQALVAFAFGLWTIYCCRFAYHRPRLAIERWRSQYWYLKLESSRSQKFIRVMAVFGAALGSLMIVEAVDIFLARRRGSMMADIAVSMFLAVIVLYSGRKRQ